MILPNISSFASKSILDGTDLIFIQDSSNNKYNINYTDLKTQISSLPYKVYTALLTQYSPATGIVLGPLYIGGRYTITTADDGDFANVGALANTQGTIFIATGTTPTSFGTAKLDRDGAPIVTVLQNTIGNIVWSYGSLGEYSATLANSFPLDKTIVLGLIMDWNNGEPFAGVTIANINYIIVNTYNFSGVNNDNGLYNTSIEIRVYP